MSHPSLLQTPPHSALLWFFFKYIPEPKLKLQIANCPQMQRKYTQAQPRWLGVIVNVFRARLSFMELWRMPLLQMMAFTRLGSYPRGCNQQPGVNLCKSLKNWKFKLILGPGKLDGCFYLPTLADGRNWEILNLFGRPLGQDQDQARTNVGPTQIERHKSDFWLSHLTGICHSDEISINLIFASVSLTEISFWS